MKWIDMLNWERKNHFRYFMGLDYPHSSICANLDITHFYQMIKRDQKPFFASFLYATSRAANEIIEFRYRIRNNAVVEHVRVSPSFTIMTSQEVFSFCTAVYEKEFKLFLDKTTHLIESAKLSVNLEDEPGRDDLLYITSIPWVSFTGITHPIHMHPVDSIPRISWGKYFDENGRLKIPLSVQVHHALVDGAHIGHYFEILQHMMDHPDAYFLDSPEVD